MQREWIDWNAPCLPAAARWLIDRLTADAVCDLGRVLCVTPGARSGQMLLTELVVQCRAAAIELIPGRIITPGHMLDTLLAGEASVRRASSTERRLAWLGVLRRAEANAMAAILPTPPDRDDLRFWHRLAENFADLQHELAGEGLTFQDLAGHADEMTFDREAERWRTLDRLSQDYDQILREQELVDPLPAHTEALSHWSAPEDQSLVLIGVTDLTALQRRLVAAMADRSTALVFAPPSLSDRFDEFGGVRAERWVDAAIAIDDETLIVADRPPDQAQAALDAMARLDGRYGPDEVTIGLGDELLADALTRAGRVAGVHLHHGRGLSLTRTAPFRLLEGVWDWLRDSTFANFATLLRHPDLERWLTSRLDNANRDGSDKAAVVDWISLIDRYFSDHLQQRFTGQWLGQPDRARRLKAVYEAVTDLIAPLIADTTRPLPDWIEPILDVLRSVYQGHEDQLPAQRRGRLLAACTALRDACAELGRAAGPLQPEVNGSVASQFVLAAARDQTIADDPRSDQIEMLGWLELPLDPAPALIVTGVNDGHIPQARGADSFLPDALREQAGLPCNATRQARDAYLLTSLLHSRKHLTLITGRRGYDNEPLTPSRLLLATDGDTLARRVQRLSDRQRAYQADGWRGADPPADDSCFVIPTPPAGAAQIDHLSVTAFRNYLSCPYRFWLRHIERLESVDDDANELDAMQFGLLAHAILHAFGQSPEIAHSDNEDRIADFLIDELHQQLRADYGDAAPPAVRIQALRFETRLRAFARRQAQHRRAGWRIDRVEFSLPPEAQLDVGDQPPMRITGKIDRLDHHEETGERLIIDYKTGEKPKTPAKAHLNGDEWVDLQLPLYQHLLGQLEEGGRVTSAYFNLPRAADDAGIYPAAWDDADWSGPGLSGAIKAARDVIRRIRAGQFEQRDTLPSHFHDEYEFICQTTVFGGDDDPEADDS